MKAAMRDYGKILCIWMMILLSGCGKSQAEEILLENSGQAEALGREMEATKTPEITEAPVQPIVNVVCNCRCGAGGAQGEQPSVEGSSSSGSQVQSPVSGQAEPDKVNINTADMAALTTLNGIGEVRARAIISHRETYGAFQTIEDLKNVNGIKDGVYNKIKEDISVG